jgi:hypothetical protein
MNLVQWCENQAQNRLTQPVFSNNTEPLQMLYLLKGDSTELVAPCRWRQKSKVIDFVSDFSISKEQGGC